MDISSLILDDNYSFGMEFFGRKARLIVYEGGVEKVCRRETLKKLKDFLQSDNVHLFKGRLQLHKNREGIVILAGGKIAGILNSHTFIELIGQRKT